MLKNLFKKRQRRISKQKRNRTLLQIQLRNHLENTKNLTKLPLWLRYHLEKRNHKPILPMFSLMMYSFLSTMLHKDSILLLRSRTSCKHKVLIRHQWWTWLLLHSRVSCKHKVLLRHQWWTWIWWILCQFINGALSNSQVSTQICKIWTLLKLMHRYTQVWCIQTKILPRFHLHWQVTQLRWHLHKLNT